jgi:hypothetical protein
MRWLLLLPAILLTACGDETVPVDASAADARSADAAQAADAPASVDAPAAPDAASPDGAAAVALITCEADGSAFPPLDKSCSVPDDCAIAIHQFICCGSKRAIGIRGIAQSTFDTAEAACRALYPDCRCAVLPTTAEDGRDETQGPLEVDCVEGVCMTYVP